MHDAFGDLRALLQRTPSLTEWTRLCSLIESFEAHDYAERIEPYVRPYLKQWPDTLRVMPGMWVRALLHGRVAQGVDLCKRLVLKDLTLSHEVLDVLQSQQHRIFPTITNFAGSLLPEEHDSRFYALPMLAHTRHVHFPLTLYKQGGPRTSEPNNAHLAGLPSDWDIQSISGPLTLYDVTYSIPAHTLQTLESLDFYFSTSIYSLQAWKPLTLPSLRHLRLSWFPRLLRLPVMRQELLDWLHELTILDNVEVLELMEVGNDWGLIEVLRAHPWPNLKAVHAVDEPTRTPQFKDALGSLPADGRPVPLRTIHTQSHTLTWPEHFRRMGVSVDW